MGMHTDVGGGYAEKEVSPTSFSNGRRDTPFSMDYGFMPIRDAPRAFVRQTRMDICTIRDNAWKKWVFKKSPRKWLERIGKPVIHQSSLLRTPSASNVPNGGYKPWIMQIDYEVEPWTHLDDWKSNPAFKDAKDALEALEEWCDPKIPRP